MLLDVKRLSMCFANATSKKVGGLTSEGAANSVNSIEQNQHEHHTSPARSLPRQVYKEKKCVEGVPARSSTLDEVKVQIVNTCSSCQVQRGTFSNFWDRPQYSALVFHTLNIYSSISEKEFATVCFFSDVSSTNAANQKQQRLRPGPRCSHHRRSTDDASVPEALDAKLWASWAASSC